MIAPAMNTGSEDCLSFRDLARQEARISRSIDLAEFSRLHRLLEFDPAAEKTQDPATDDSRAAATGSGPAVRVELEFRLDDESLAWVDGQASVAMSLLCNRCAEAVVFPLTARFEVCIVADDVVADTLADSRDVLVASGPTISIVEIVEDELLLALPERLCLEEPCSRMPALAYPAAESVDTASGPTGQTGQRVTSGSDSERADQDNPFAVLQGLKTELRKENEER